MYYTLSSKITITDATGKGLIVNHISSAEISNSVRDLGGSAKIVLPRRTQPLRAHSDLEEEKVLDYLKPGMRVKVELGYNGDLHTEFEGYIREVQSGAPIQLILDDQYYPLKTGAKLIRSWAKTTLREVLGYILSGYAIDCPDLELVNWAISNASQYAALNDLRERIGFYARVDTVQRTCKCYWAYDFQTQALYTYHFQRNVRKSDLTYVRKEDVKVRIEAVAPLRSGEKLKVTAGSNDSDARIISRNFNFVGDEIELKKLADAEVDKMSYDGYQGTVTGFGLPLTHAGDALRIIDEKEKERQGTYLIEKVVIKYSQSGYHRINTLSYKI